ASQLDIIDTLPGDKGYNDFRQVWKVWVPKDYVANTITDARRCSKRATKWKRRTSCLIWPWYPTTHTHASALTVETPNCNAPGITTKSQNFSSSTRRLCRYQ